MQYNLQQLEDKAINAGISFDWLTAIKINKQILKLDKNDLASYLRLGFANLQLGNLEEAKKYYLRALKLQPANQLVRENLERIKILNTRKLKKETKEKIILDPNLFLEIPGKTKSARLVNLGQKNILAQLITGQEVFFKPRKRKIEIRNSHDDYIGSLTDDLSKRLTLFIKAGSKYGCYIKESGLSRIVVFIKEEMKAKKVQKFSSFPQNTTVNLSQLAGVEEAAETEDEDLADSDLEKLAEVLASEDKDYLPFAAEADEDEEGED